MINNLEDIVNKYRQARKGNTELVVIEGAHAFKHAVRFGAEIVHVALSSDSEARGLLERFGTEIELNKLDKYSEIVSNEIWSNLSVHPPDTGLIALAKKPLKLGDRATKFTGDTVIFIEDPHSLFNVGAIIRTAVAVGVTSLAISGRHNPWHADCISTARGLNFALEYLSVISIEELKDLAESGEYIICAMEVGGENILKTKLPKKRVLVFGTERDGISPGLSSLASKHLSLPMREGVSSLNLANSVSGVLYGIK